jgi:hypothetical protein
MRRVLRAVAALVLVAGAVGCGQSGRPDTNDRMVRQGSPRTSPSGDFIAAFQDGPDQNGVATVVVVITDASGTEVFHDDDAYSTRHGVGVTWLSTSDQLWILSSDVGTSHVEQHDGVWVKTAMTPQTLDTIPEEIEHLS